jgi:hypothetical protein
MDFGSNTQECIPLSTYADFCTIIGLNWAMAEELFEKNLLTHKPVIDEFPNDEAQKELIFIGTMISAGITLDILRFVTSSLQSPYSYSHKDIYFDWSSGQWLDKPRQGEHWEVALAHIDELEASQDIDSLMELKNHVEEAINSLSTKK